MVAQKSLNFPDVKNPFIGRHGPVTLDGVTNVWCATISAAGDFALVNFASIDTWPGFKAKVVKGSTRL
jgi:hypothetical protein